MYKLWISQNLASLFPDESFRVVFICGFGTDCHSAQSLPRKPVCLPWAQPSELSTPGGPHVEFLSWPSFQGTQDDWSFLLTVDLKHSQDLLKRLKASVFPIWFYFAVIAGKHFSKPGTKKLLAFRAGNQWVMYENFIFLGSKITVGSDYNHEIKRHLLLERKSDTPRQLIKKQRHHFVN